MTKCFALRGVHAALGSETLATCVACHGKESGTFPLGAFTDCWAPLKKDWQGDAGTVQGELLLPSLVEPRLCQTA